MEPTAAGIEALAELGFTELEAQIYAFLLQESPATAYRIAQGTGRLPANTYNAVESLQAKGAILVDEGTNRHCRAVPPRELLALLQRRFDERRERATKALAELESSSPDERVYQLRSRA